MPQPYIRKKYTTDYIALPEYLGEQARKGLFIKKLNLYGCALKKASRPNWTIRLFL